MSSTPPTYKFLPNTPNFSTTNSVFLPNVSLQDAFTMLGTSAGHERVCRLSKLCTKFELLQKDTIAIPFGINMNQVSVRTGDVPRVDYTDREGDGSNSSRDEGEEAQCCHRQRFLMEETVTIIFGLIKSKVRLDGTLSWIEPSSPYDTIPLGTPLYALYESLSDGPGILVWKCRKFEEVEEEEEKEEKLQRGGKVDMDEYGENNEPRTTRRGVRVTESIKGMAPRYLKNIVYSEAVKGHQAHMAMYHTLFNNSPQ